MKKRLAIFGSLKFGTGDYIAHLYPHLKMLFDIEVLSFSHMKYDDPVTPEESELVFKNIPSPRLLVRPKSFLTLAESYLKVFNFLNTFKPDVFNLQVTAFIRVLHYFFYPLLINLKEKGTKIIFTFHDVFHIGEKEIITNEILSPFYKLADAGIVGNSMEKDRLKKILKFDKEILIGKHGVYNLFDQNSITAQSARKQLKINPNNFIVLFFGILRENKGLEELINAIKLLKSRNSLQNIKLYVYTTLRDHFELKDHYEKLIRQLKLEKEIIADIRIKRIMTLKEIETTFKASDIVILPYTHISQSGILNLAIGFRKPVILSDAFVETNEVNNKLGIIVPKKNVEKLADAIFAMANNYENYSKIFSNNISDYEKEHSWEKLAHQMLEIANRI